jgi:hypothetical protein
MARDRTDGGCGPIKAGGETGVLIDNYAADAPIVLSKITRQ